MLLRHAGQAAGFRERRHVCATDGSAENTVVLTSSLCQHAEDRAQSCRRVEPRCHLSFRLSALLRSQGEGVGGHGDKDEGDGEVDDRRVRVGDPLGQQEVGDHSETNKFWRWCRRLRKPAVADAWLSQIAINSAFSRCPSTETK